MKQFGIIFKFELLELMKTKAYKITTIIFLLVAVVGLSLPSIFPSMLESSNTGDANQFTDEGTFAILDENNILGEEDTFQLIFPNVEMKKVESIKEIETLISDEKVDAGFYLKDELTFEYYVLNSDVYDVKPSVFSQLLTLNYQNKKMVELGLDQEAAASVLSAQASYETQLLGTDGSNNLAYTFILIMVIYMVVILYGNSIATTVASEKGNRTMELLVTSAKPTALIFGKVLAGCLAAIIQVGLLIAVAKTTYSLNAEAWGGMLDMVFNIPMDVLGAFAAFGILGFIFYSFIFGALGALVSKSEDVNSSSTPITIVFIAVYFVVYIGVLDPSSTIFTIASYVPFSSPMAMFSRMAMVDVPMVEVMISLAILVASTILVGFGASKIYRRATLMYGNQIKITHAFKWLTKKEK